MAVRGSTEVLGGLPVHLFMSDDDIEEIAEEDCRPDESSRLASVVGTAPAPDAVAWKIATHFDAELEFDQIFGLFLEHVDTTRVRALVTGYWGTDILSDEDPIIPRLIAHADRFPALRHLFLCDIAGDEHEISWIPGEDLTPLLAAFPRLEELVYRFGHGHDRAELPVLTPTRHENLRRLVLQTGGMPAHLPRAVADSDLPALEHLDLWLGVEMYGGDATVADLAALLDGTRLPALRHLGLMNSEIQDEVARAVSAAPLVAKLSSLDLSMGMLSDTGGEALLTGQPLTHLDTLTIRHHFLGDGMVRRLKEALVPAGVTVDISAPCTPWSGARTPEEGRYTAVSE